MVKLLSVFQYLNDVINLFGVVVFHSTQSNDSQYNNARLINKSCLYLYTINRLGQGKQLTSHRILHWIISIGLHSFLLQQKPGKIACHFFPAVYVPFSRQSHLICLEYWFMQFAVKYYLHCSDMSGKIAIRRQVYFT